MHNCSLVPRFFSNPSFITLCQGTVEESGNEASIIVLLNILLHMRVFPPPSFYGECMGRPGKLEQDYIGRFIISVGVYCIRNPVHLAEP